MAEGQYTMGKSELITTLVIMTSRIVNSIIVVVMMVIEWEL